MKRMEELRGVKGWKKREERKEKNRVEIKG